MPATLHSKATKVDIICSISEPLLAMDGLSPLIKLLTLAFQIRQPDPSTQERLTTLMHTMSVSVGPEERRASTDNPKCHSREEVFNSFIGFLMPVLSGMAGLSEFESAVSAFSQPEDFREFWNIEGRNLIAEFVAGDGPGRVMKGSDIEFQKVFVKDSNCRIALGKEKGILMLVPRDAEVGDVLMWNQDDNQLAVISPAQAPRMEGDAYIEAETRKLIVNEMASKEPRALDGQKPIFNSEIKWNPE